MDGRPGRIDEHATRRRGSLSADMSTIEDIDREAARRVAVALGDDERGTVDEEGVDDDASASLTEQAKESRPWRQASRRTDPVARTWRVARRMLPLTVVGVAITVLLRIGGNFGHGSARVGSLNQSGAVAQTDPQGASKMKSTIRRPIAAAAVTAIATVANAQQAVQWRDRKSVV